MNDEELLRYSRQIMLPQIDIRGQDRLLDASVLIVGMGGLGSPIALYLAAAGVGRLVIADDDVVDTTNLARQIVHRENAVGAAKVESARQTLAALNSSTTVDILQQRMDATTLEKTIPSVDLALDATDNFSARYDLNRACIEHKVPLVSAAAVRWEGQVAVFDARDPESPCYRCLYSEGDDRALNCSETGVVGPLLGIIGSLQATEAIKLLTGVGQPLTGYLMVFDALAMEWRKLRLRRREGCPDCSQV